MDGKDRLLLTYLQNGLPLTPGPFAVWAAKLGTDNADLLVRIQRLKKEGTFGGIRPVLDFRFFHYQSSWVALRICSGGIESRTEVLWQHPGVIYGCEREHEFNVWFFIAVPADHDLELHVRCLEKLLGAEEVLFLPVRKIFKGSDLLNSLGTETFPVMSERFEKRRTIRAPDLAAEEIDMIRQLQEAFPLTDEPYQKIAADLGITEAQVLERMRSLVRKGCLRKIGSFLKPVTSVSEARTLVVWKIPEEKLERIGPEIAAFREVLYADRRPAYPEFPYSLYTMILGETPEELELIIRRMQDRIGKWPHRVMMTTREFKKERMKYFPKELDVWWQQSRHINETIDYRP
jgi:DNA-binding Lrp family transcriptional regulator